MAIPSPSAVDPILYHEHKVWVKGIAAGLFLPIDLELVGGAAITLGQKAMATSLPVVPPSDWTPGRVPNIVRSGILINSGPGTFGISTPIGPDPVLGAELVYLQWSHAVRGATLAAAENQLTIDIFDGTTARGLVTSFVQEGEQDSGVVTFPFPLVPILNNGVNWQLRATIARLVGAVNSDVAVQSYWLSGSR